MKVIKFFVVLVIGQRAKGEKVSIPTPPKVRQSTPKEIERWAREYNFGRLSERRTVHFSQNYFN